MGWLNVMEGFFSNGLPIVDTVFQYAKKLPAWAVKEFSDEFDRAPAWVQNSMSGNFTQMQKKQKINREDLSNTLEAVMEFSAALAVPEILPEVMPMIVAELETMGISSGVLSNFAAGVDLVTGGAKAISTILGELGISVTPQTISRVEVILKQAGKFVSKLTSKSTDEVKETPMGKSAIGSDVFAPMGKSEIGGDVFAPNKELLKKEFLSIGGADEIGYSGEDQMEVDVRNIGM